MPERGKKYFHRINRLSEIDSGSAGDLFAEKRHSLPRQLDILSIKLWRINTLRFKWVIFDPALGRSRFDLVVPAMRSELLRSSVTNVYNT